MEKLHDSRISRTEFFEISLEQISDIRILEALNRRFDFLNEY